MGSDWVTDINPGYRTKTIKVGNATVVIHRPILTDEEWQKAEEKVIQALSCYGKGLKN